MTRSGAGQSEGAKSGSTSAVAPPKLRLDKWLWHARFFKTRTLAAKIVSGAHVRVNAHKVSKPSATVCAGDVLTFVQGNAVRIVKVLALGERRGPAPEAQALYQDMSPEPAPPELQPERVGGRPTKKDRRAVDALKNG